MDFRKTTSEPTVPEFNAALDVLFYTRTSGEPLTLILETYNDMVARGLVPNSRTYIILIMALTDRDHEVQWQIEAIEQRQKWAKMGSRLMDETLDRDQHQLRLFREENNMTAAINLFRAMMAVKQRARTTIPGNVFRGLLRSCAMHATEPGMVASAIQVWSQMERFSPNNLHHSAFIWMINMYAKLKDITAAQLVFSQFKTATSEGRVAWGIPHADFRLLFGMR
ncbi:hypothetical protein BDZ89DRAFT_737469 [Hymenopellis radicata]|nr:hypothetical protein BDZ89DRAFT_737469 [Hymenopellis radicata]